MNITWDGLLSWIDADVAKSIRPEEFEQKTECFPSQSLPVLLPYQGKVLIRKADWGIKRNWSKKSIINLQLEKITGNTFNTLYQRNRLILPATCFYEWNEGQKWQIDLKDQEIFGLAGVWEKRENTGTFALLTTAANHSMKSIHARMPVLVNQGNINAWLSGEYDLSTQFQQESFHWRIKKSLV